MNKNEFSASVNIKTSYGKYAWCGNGYDNIGSGYYLSTIDDRNYKDNKLLLDIVITMNTSLASKTDIIEIYDSTGFLAHYSYSELIRETGLLYYKCRYTTGEDLIGTKLKIYFRELRKDVPNRRMFSRAPMNTIHTIETTIPELKIYGNETVCALCFDKPNNDNKYVNQCSH